MAVCILVGNSSGFLLHVPVGGSRKKNLFLGIGSCHLGMGLV